MESAWSSGCISRRIRNDWLNFFYGKGITYSMRVVGEKNLGVSGTPYNGLVYLITDIFVKLINWQ